MKGQMALTELKLKDLSRKYHNTSNEFDVLKQWTDTFIEKMKERPILQTLSNSMQHAQVQKMNDLIVDAGLNCIIQLQQLTIQKQTMTAIKADSRQTHQRSNGNGMDEEMGKWGEPRNINIAPIRSHRCKPHPTEQA